MIGGRYTLVRELGRGGMGAVWLATDAVLGREVAMKRLHAASDQVGARAEREARLAAGLSDPRVVAVYDLLSDGGDLWLVMEYVDGPTLAGAVATRGPLSPDAAAEIFSSVTAALRAAHAAGIVHRDVKPSNILMASDGSVKLTDFGVARATEADVTLTAAGVVTGSPAYLAPEVAAGGPATFASDVWSLGAALFHAVTGRPPYEVLDGNVLGTLYRIVHEDPPRTDGAGWLAPLLEGTMTSDVTRRWDLDRVRTFLAGGPDATVAAGPLAGAVPAAAYDASPTAVLSQAMPPAPTTAPPRPARRSPQRSSRGSRRGLLAVLAVAAVVLLAVVIGILTTRGDGTHPTAAGTRATTPPPSHTPTSQSPSPSPTTQSPDAPTAAGIDAFVHDYLAAASSDPRRAFEMLTPDFQRASGGWYGYDGFWGDVTKIHSVDNVAPALDPLGVSYTYTYSRRHEGTRTDPVSLRLVYQDGRYLIAGDDSVPSHAGHGHHGDQGNHNG